MNDKTKNLIYAVVAVLTLIFSIALIVMSILEVEIPKIFWILFFLANLTNTWAILTRTKRNQAESNEKQ